MKLLEKKNFLVETRSKSLTPWLKPIWFKLSNIISALTIEHSTPAELPLYYYSLTTCVFISIAYSLCIIFFINGIKMANFNFLVVLRVTLIVSS